MNIFNLKIKQLVDDYNMKKKKAFMFYEKSEIEKDPKGKSTLLDKSEKWMNKAELVLKKIEEIKQTEDIIAQKRAELNKNQLETNNQGKNIL